jgi:hypothetical protein
MRLSISDELYRAFSQHLDSRPESVGFFLADWEADSETFLLIDWSPAPDAGFADQSDYHLSLTDAYCNEMILWAWRSGKCLVEAHSHVDWGPAGFSGSDMFGFSEWVPHLWWRLRGRPYAAIVKAGETLDAIAWIRDPNVPEQIVQVDVEDQHLLSTRNTLGRPRSGGRYAP